MATFSIDDVKALREATGVSIMQCQKALEEAGGDKEKALVLVKKRAGAIAEKKGDRELGSGVVATYVHDGAVGAMVELRCETDFVAKNEEFPKLAKEIAMQVAATGPTAVSLADVSEEAMHAAREIFEQEVAGKPEELKAQILEGKLRSHFKDSVLLLQPFIKDDTKTIETLVHEAVQKFGERIEIARMVRFSTRG